MFELSRVIGHRGLAAVAPENTLAGLRAARDAGLDFAEVDILPSADGAAVLSHEDSLLRRGGVEKNVTQTNLAELLEIPVGLGFPSFATERIPSLTEALLFCGEAGLGLVLELKPEGGAAGARALAAGLAEAKSRGRIPQRLMISSFGAEMLELARALAPEVPRALNLWDLRLDWRALSARTGCANLHANWRAASPLLARSVAGAGMGFYCYTVNNRGLYWLLRGMGADGVFTDSPKVAAAGGS